MKLTKVRREVLQLLGNGKIMTIDCYNMASIGERNIAPQTRYFLTENRYVTRKDKTKSVESSGNGFIITRKAEWRLLRARNRKSGPPARYEEKKKNVRVAG